MHIRLTSYSCQIINYIASTGLLCALVGYYVPAVPARQSVGRSVSRVYYVNRVASEPLNTLKMGILDLMTSIAVNCLSIVITLQDTFKPYFIHVPKFQPRVPTRPDFIKPTPQSETLLPMSRFSRLMNEYILYTVTYKILLVTFDI